MHFEKQLPANLSPVLFTGQRSVRTISPLPRLSSSNSSSAFAGRSRALPPHVHSFQQIDLRRGEGSRTGEGTSVRTGPGQDASWRAIPDATFGIGARVIEGLAAGVELVFSRFLLVFMSWTMAQVLAGCAAYAQAMYPCFVEDPTGGQADRSGPSDAEYFPPSARTGSAVIAPVAVEYIARLERPRASLLDASPTIASPASRLLSRVRRERDRRLAMAELRSLDDRALRDIGISRCDIEYFASQGDRRE